MDPTQNPAPTSTNDDSEWDEVGLDFLSDKGLEQEKNPREQRTIDEQAKSQKTTEEEGASQDDPANKEQNEESKLGDEADKATGQPGEAKPGEAGTEPETKTQQPATDPDAEDRARRRVQLDIEADRKELANDIREKMFSEVPQKLLDAEGREIRVPQDVTQYKNPATGQNFTLEEGTRWLQLAQMNLEDKSKQAQSEIDKIVDVNITIKEEAQEVLEKFGPLLQANPKLRKEVWEDYRNTLDISADGEVITGAKLSMKNFYNRVLTPYLAEAIRRQKTTQEQAQANADEQARKAELAKKATEQKAQSQSDREDVFSTRTKGHEGMDPEEKEWADVGKEYFES